MPFDEQNLKEKENPTVEAQASAEKQNRSRANVFGILHNHAPTAIHFTPPSNRLNPS
jgi:hypothetical protein